MTENGEVVKTELETAETLNNLFGNVIKNLMIPKYSEYDPSIDTVENRTIRAILKYRNHPSILAIRERKKHRQIFVLKKFLLKKYKRREILNLNNKKASQNSNIPIKIIKENCEKVIYIPFLAERGRRYSNSQKSKKDKKENYRPVSILPVLSKICERIMFIQMSNLRIPQRL